MSILRMSPRHALGPAGLAVLVAAAGLAASACGVPTQATPSPLPGQLPAALSVAPASTLAPKQAGYPLTIYLVNALQQMVAVTRHIPPLASHEPPVDLMQRALSELALGPESQEVQNGYTTDLPPSPGLTMLQLAADGVAEVGVNATFLAQGGQQAIGEYAQVVFTLIQFRGVKAVQFFTAGVPSGALLSNGQFVTRPVVAKDYSTLLATT